MDRARRTDLYVLFPTPSTTRTALPQRDAQPTNKRATAMDYRGTVVEKDQDVIVPATEYFAQKNDPIVPILCEFEPVEDVEGWCTRGGVV